MAMRCQSRIFPTVQFRGKAATYRCPEIGGAGLSISVQWRRFCVSVMVLVRRSIPLYWHRSVLAIVGSGHQGCVVNSTLEKRNVEENRMTLR
jgi:hypothetical protein